MSNHSPFRECCEHVENAYRGWLEDLPYLYEGPAGECIAENLKRLDECIELPAGKLETCILLAGNVGLAFKLRDIYGKLQAAARAVDAHFLRRKFRIHLWLYGDVEGMNEFIYPASIAETEKQAIDNLQSYLSDGKVNKKKALQYVAFQLAAAFSRFGRPPSEARKVVHSFVQKHGRIVGNDGRMIRVVTITNRALRRAYGGADTAGWAYVAQKIDANEIRWIEQFGEELTILKGLASAGSEANGIPPHSLNSRPLSPPVLRGSLIDGAERNIIDATKELGAVSPETRQTARAIVCKAFGPQAEPNNYKRTLAQMVKRGDLNSISRGRAGGYWIAG